MYGEAARGRRAAIEVARPSVDGNGGGGGRRAGEVGKLLAPSCRLSRGVRAAVGDAGDCGAGCEGEATVNVRDG